VLLSNEGGGGIEIGDTKDLLTGKVFDVDGHEREGRT